MIPLAASQETRRLVVDWFKRTHLSCTLRHCDVFKHLSSVMEVMTMESSDACLSDVVHIGCNIGNHMYADMPRYISLPYDELVILQEH